MLVAAVLSFPSINQCANLLSRLEAATSRLEDIATSTELPKDVPVLNQPVDVYPLVGCRTAEEFRENAAAVEVTLTPEQLAWLESGE